MKKRIAALLLCLAFLLCATSASPAFTPGALAEKPRVAGVDYARLWKPTGLDYTFDVIIGRQTFPGTLTRELALNEDEVDAILHKTLRQLNMTEGTLIRCNAAIEKADAIPDFDFKEAVRLLCEFTGVQTVVDLVGVVTGWGNQSSEAVATSLAVDKAVVTAATKAAQKAGGELAAAAATKLGGLAISLLYNAGKTTVKEIADLEEKKEIMRDAIDALRTLEVFYNRARENLKLEDALRGGDWVIRIDSEHTDYQVAFLGVEGNTQTWHVWGELKRQRNFHTKTGDPSGTYQGEFNIEVTHNLAAFDANFHEEVVKKAPFYLDFVKLTESIAPLLAAEANISYFPPAYSYTTLLGGASELAKLYHQQEFTLELAMTPGVRNRIDVPFYLSGMDVDSTFQVPHTLELLPIFNAWKAGHISAHGSSANMDMLFGYLGKFAEETVPALYPENLTLNYSAFSQYGSYELTDTTEFSVGEEDNGYWRLIVGKDPRILRDLRGRTCFRISGGGKAGEKGAAK